MSDTKNLKSLGAKTKYETAKVNPEVLEVFDNQNQDTIQLVPLVQDRDEFTSLCPRTGQPDHARIEIIYVPNKKMIESKSLKLYLFSFRNTGEFHEDCMARICKDLWAILQPKYLRVYGNFVPRGGIAIRPIAEKWQKDLPQGKYLTVINLVSNWDIKSK